MAGSTGSLGSMPAVKKMSRAWSALGGVQGQPESHALGLAIAGEDNAAVDEGLRLRGRLLWEHGVPLV